MRKKLLSSADVKLFKLNYEKVMKSLIGYASRVVTEGAKAVILVGSLARGDYTAFSDADVVIISDKVPSRVIDRITNFIDPTLPIDIEPLVYTTEEIIKMAREGRGIIKEIVRYGKVLAGDKGIINELRELLKKCSS